METAGQHIVWSMSFLLVSILMFGQEVRELQRPPRSPQHRARLENIVDCDGSRITAALTPNLRQLRSLFLLHIFRIRT